jgi:hypothetical protein
MTTSMYAESEIEKFCLEKSQICKKQQMDIMIKGKIEYDEIPELFFSMGAEAAYLHVLFFIDKENID